MTVNTVNLENHQPQTPLGLLLAPLVSQGHPPQESHYTILIGWTRPYNKLGIVQKSGQIRIGDRLVEINGISVRNWTFEKIIRVLRCFDDGVRIRSLGFEVLKDEGGIENRTFVWSVARRRLYSLNTSIRSVVVLPLEEGDQDNPNEQEDTNHNDNNNNNGNNKNSKRRMVAKYEIRCDLVIRHYHGNDEVIQYSVWKRFSDFQKLHQNLMEKFSYKSYSRSSSRRRRNNNNTTTSAATTTTTRTTAITDGIAFPSNRVLQSILYGTSSEWFLEQRKRELQDYWTCLSSHHPEFFEFGDPANHRYCQETALFLEIEQYLHPSTKKLGHLEKQKHKQKQKQKQKQTQQESLLSLSSLPLPLPSPLHFELELDTSAISEIPMGTSTASISSDLRKLVVLAVDEGNVDQSNLSGNGNASFDGNNNGEEGVSTSIQASTSNSMKAMRQRDKKQIIVTKDNLNNSKKKKKKKKKIASAKPAFQRKLLEE